MSRKYVLERGTVSLCGLKVFLFWFAEFFRQIDVENLNGTQFVCFKSGHKACVTTFESNFVGRSTENIRQTKINSTLKSYYDSKSFKKSLSIQILYLQPERNLAALWAEAFQPCSLTLFYPGSGKTLLPGGAIMAPPWFFGFGDTKSPKLNLGTFLGLKTT